MYKETFTNNPGKNLGNFPWENSVLCNKTDLSKLARLANKFVTTDFLKLRDYTVLGRSPTQDYCFF